MQPPVDRAYPFWVYCKDEEIECRVASAGAHPMAGAHAHHRRRYEPARGNSCDAIIIIVAFCQGDQDLELFENVAALEFKYKSRCKVHSSTVFHEGDVLPQSKVDELVDYIIAFLPAPSAPTASSSSAAAPGGGTGLYLIMHGGHDGITKPPTAQLAEVVARVMIGSRIPIRKINLAACHTARGFSGGQSALNFFCTALRDRMAKAERMDMLEGMMVCGYDPEVTTLYVPGEYGWLQQHNKDEDKYRLRPAQIYRRVPRFATRRACAERDCESHPQNMVVDASAR